MGLSPGKDYFCSSEIKHEFKNCPGSRNVEDVGFTDNINLFCDIQRYVTDDHACGKHLVNRD
jgi:hypothetical protein